MILNLLNFRSFNKLQEYFKTINATIPVIIQGIVKVSHTWIGSLLKESPELVFLCRSKLSLCLQLQLMSVRFHMSSQYNKAAKKIEWELEMLIFLYEQVDIQ